MIHGCLCCVQPMGALEDAKTTVGAKLEERGEAFPDDFINMLHLKPPRA